MGFIKLIWDGIGINTCKLKGSLRETSQKMRETKKRLRNIEKCRKLK